MNVVIVPVGDLQSPGTRLRALAYVPFFEGRGWDVTVSLPLVSSGRRTRSPRPLRMLEILRDMVATSRSDVVLIYRKTFPGASARLLRLVARRIVYEFDDAVFLPSPREPQDDTTRARYQRNFRSTAAIADLIVAGNRNLAAEVEGRPVEILPTGVDLSVFRPSRARASTDGCVVGWIGTRENLLQWQRLLPAFRQVVAVDPSIRFKVVSDGELPECDLPVDFERFSIEREARCIEDFDIGVMPLEDTAWNRGKCSCKALQCMAMSQPVVVSPVGMNRDVVEPGVSGAFATCEDEWVRELLRLAGDPDLRSRMGRAARAVVEQSYSLERVGSRMADLLGDIAI